MADLIRSIIREELNVAMDKLQPQLDSLKAEFDECKGKVTNMERELSSTQKKVEDTEKLCKALQEENKELREKTERLESYSRRFNIRVFGLDKDIEKGNPTQFMSSFLKEAFKEKKLPCEPEVEIAHRVGPATRTGSRPMIVRLQRYQVKEAILNIAKKEKVLKYKDMNIKIFPDLTAETAKRRAQFKDLRNKLYQARIKNGLIHPATLIITFEGVTKHFQDKERYYNQSTLPTLSAGRNEEDK